jgi:hypothetical protein
MRNWGESDSSINNGEENSEENFMDFGKKSQTFGKYWIYSNIVKFLQLLVTKI